MYRILLETFLANTTNDQESLSLLIPKKTSSTLKFLQSKIFSVERKIKMQRQNELFRSFLIFQEMKSNGIEADSAIYNTLINACAEAGDLEKVIFHVSINSLFYFKILTINTPLPPFLQALETIQWMQEDGIEPDVITYTSLIKACAIQGTVESSEIADNLFQSMQQRTNHFSSYIDPNELTVSRLMQAHLAAENPNRVLELLDLLKFRGIPPGVYSYM